MSKMRTQAIGCICKYKSTVGYWKGWEDRPLRGGKEPLLVFFQQRQ